MNDSRTGAAGLGTLARHIAVTVVTRVGVVALGFATAALRGHGLGAQEFGAFAVALLMPVLLVSLLNMGVAAANAYYIGRGEVSVRTACTLVFQIWAAMSLIGLAAGAAMILWGAAEWLPGASTPMLWLGLATFPPTLLKDLLGSVLLGAQDVRWFNRAPLMSAAAILGFSALALAVDGGLAGVLVAHLAGTALGAALCAWRLHSHVRQAPRETSSESYLRRYLSYGWKANLQWFLNFVNYRVDLFLLNLLTGGPAVGAYAAAMLLTEKLWLLAQAASSVLKPRLAATYAKGPVKSELTPLVSRWVMLATLVPAALLGLLTGRGLAVVFGEDFAVAGPALAWLLPGAVLMNSTRILTADLHARGRVDLCMISSFVLVFVNIGLNLVLIPRMGITGAAIASTTGYAVRTAIVLHAYVRLSGARWTACFIPVRSDWDLVMRAARSFILRPSRA
jgi:O-antigen/teichoic acid export membrane protein